MANEHINWYPGHMKKTRELIQENLKLVNAAVEILDARIPVSSKNPVIDELIKNKRRIVILNKSDLGDPKTNEAWVRYFKAQGAEPVCMNALTGEGIADLFKVMNRMKDEINKDSVRKKPLRAMIVGIPNVGKSSLINRLAGKKSAKTGNKPGVTRGKQWINLQDQIQLLDTPGILWPKFEDKEIALKLSFVGSIKDEVLDREDLTIELIKYLQVRYPELLVNRYNIETAEGEPLEVMERICDKRGFIMSGKRYDYARAARTIMDEFRGGKMGRITLEMPGDK
ncbi:MAG: ribosome biogenesis GTPase YlqF [Firmicutes bacterium]|nr:ribosome biogenesis GTPase YlqF [Clostridiales bacterium]MBQ4340092.1 ribosome biogenesis GTPase YlqF [Bacillota bacterium]